MSDIKIIKPGQSGFGYLIEQDAGYISPTDERNKAFVNEIKKLEKGQQIITDPLELYVVLQKWGVKNRNGRIYPREILEREVERYQQLIKERRAIGELDHPDSSVVNLQNVSHNITEMHFEGDNLLGTVEILTTPSGNILKELFKSGIKLGIKRHYQHIKMQCN